MPQQCKICLTGASEWSTDRLEDHILTEHGDQEASVSAMYDDRFDHLFDGDATSREPEPPDDGDHADPTPTASGGTGSSMIGEKWFMIGVGGAGNNILDAVLLRRDTLASSDESRARIWNGGLAGYGLLNTNIAELEETYYATELKDYSRNDLLSNAIIGLGVHDYAGMGYRWDNGEEVAAADFADEKDPFRERWDMTKPDVRDAQAVMMIHSVTKGTGCGSTPVIAEKIRNEVLTGDYIVDKPLLSSVVIPSQGSNQSELGGRAKVNGVVGLARIAQSVDAIVPFNNRLLEEASADITPRISGLSRYTTERFAQLNKPLVAFLEAFTMSSTPGLIDRDATKSIKGDVFDVADGFKLVEDKYPRSMDDDRRPAVVLAPALGRLRLDDITESKLELLAQQTINQNRLADFDPSTAWGGNFIVYGPPEKMADVSTHVDDGTLHDILRRPSLLDADAVQGVGSVDIQVYQIVTPHVDDLHMWGTLWNPEMPSLANMYDHAERLQMEGNNRRAEQVEAVWDDVEALFECLGRDGLS
ncbi:cell division protein FtsZ [Halobaculum sp. MBLA0147]|uniref:cell division protein FtsZ n=1 Tax=Halobaculum sp. MBLA0147 TaxID=3079934 RepID=UPI003523FB47